MHSTLDTFNISPQGSHQNLTLKTNKQTNGIQTVYWMGRLDSVTICPEGLACQKNHEDDVIEGYFYQEKNDFSLHHESSFRKLLIKKSDANCSLKLELSV